jgi:DNA repair protein RadD
VIILQPSVEILEQNYNKLKQYVNEEEMGIYCASLDRKEIKKYTFATIGSVYKIPHKFINHKMAIVDENHELNIKKEGSMYKSFLNAIGVKKVIGLTATPYRLEPTYFKDGFTLYRANSIKLLNRMLDKKGGEKFWDRIIYKKDYKELMEAGYLSKLDYIDRTEINNIPLNKSMTDYDHETYDVILQKNDRQIISLIQEAESKHKHILVFCNSINQSERLLKFFGNGAKADRIDSQTKPKERQDIISKFKNGETKIMFNVGVLTTGFDFPELDCIIMLKPTQSVALYYQMLGRGVRIHESKEKCVVYDYAGNVKRIGRLETMELKKVNGLWNITTETMPQGYNGVQLYKIEIKR